MKIRNIITSSLGNTLEWFDFGLFIFLAPIIGEQFFPTSDPHTATIAAFSVFAGGFICRPIGGIIFGHFGDRYGRINPLRLSILIITLSTLFIGLLPSYQTAGILAPILFTLLRLLQGISIGGEYSGVMTYLAESAPPKKRGFVTSFAATGANMGFLLATVSLALMQSHLTEQSIQAWGWRLPFIFIGLLGSFITYYRLKLLETPVYQHLIKTQHVKKIPLLAALRHAPKKLLTIVGLGGMSCAFFYVFFGCMPNYLHHHSALSSSEISLFESLSLTVMLFLVPLASIAGDRFGRKNMLIITTLCMFLFVIPGFYLLLNPAPSYVLLALCLAVIFSSMDQGNTLTAVVESCPSDVRYSGVAFAYNLSSAIFGGLSPLIVITLTTVFDPIAPAYYIVITSLMGLLAALSLSSHSQSDFTAVTDLIKT